MAKETERVFVRMEVNGVSKGSQGVAVTAAADIPIHKNIREVFTEKVLTDIARKLYGAAYFMHATGPKDRQPKLHTYDISENVFPPPPDHECCRGE